MRSSKRFRCQTSAHSLIQDDHLFIGLMGAGHWALQGSCSMEFMNVAMGILGGGGGGVERAETVMMVDHCGQMGSMETRLIV